MKIKGRTPRELFITRVQILSLARKLLRVLYIPSNAPLLPIPSFVFVRLRPPLLFDGPCYTCCRHSLSLVFYCPRRSYTIVVLEAFGHSGKVNASVNKALDSPDSCTTCLLVSWGGSRHGTQHSLNYGVCRKLTIRTQSRVTLFLEARALMPASSKHVPSMQTHTRCTRPQCTRLDAHA